MKISQRLVKHLLVIIVLYNFCAISNATLICVFGSNRELTLPCQKKPTIAQSLCCAKPQFHPCALTFK